MTNPAKIECEQSVFGKMPDGQTITQYTLSNPNNMSMSVINYGATLVSVKIPDSVGVLNELTLGFNQLQAYLNHDFYFGATIGRVANRIANATFHYQGQEFHLTKNQYPYHLHGGNKGFDKAVWQAKVLLQEDTPTLMLTHISRDGDEGYPGTLKVKTTYSLSLANELKITFSAETDRTTPVDLTNHTYWNLAGAGNGTVLKHRLQVFAERYVVTDQNLIPTGRIADVAGTPFDFRQAHYLDERIQATPIGGYDLCFVLPTNKQNLYLAAQIEEPTSGRCLKVYTTQPGLQFYTGNSLANYPIGQGRTTQRYGGFCMETQNLPGAVHYSQFPSPFLLPGDRYHHETIYQLVW
jgi:aldose 1-epimerase